MSVVKKDIIRPGKWVVSDTAGNPLVFEVTPARVRHWCDQAQAMLSSGFAVPLVWEHEDPASDNFGPFPIADKQRWDAMFTAGQGKRAWVENDVLYMDFEIPDEADAAKARASQQIGKTVTRISPAFSPGFTDGDGYAWSDVLAHVALTNKPIVKQQGQFAPSTVALSSRCHVISLLSEYRGADVEEKEKDDGEFQPPEAPAETAQTPPEETETPGADDPQLARTVDPKLIEGLTAIGLIIPAATTLAELQQMLLVALATAAATKLQSEVKEPDEGNEASLSDVDKKEETQVVMSTKVDARLQVLEQENAALKGQVFASQRAVVLSRIERLRKEGRLSPAQKEKLDKKLPTVRMSLTTTGAVLDDPATTAILEFSETVPVGTFWTEAEKKEQLDEHTNERFFADKPGEFDDKAIKSVVAEQMKSIGK